MKRPATQLLNGFFNGRFARFIVILFLVYAGVDIANPQFCNDEFTPPPFVLALNAEPRAEEPSTVSIAGSEGTEQREQPSAPHSDDDCFCCCTHVLPAPTTHPNGASDVVSQEYPLVTESVSSAHVNALYHPPRTV